jgi:hypothetical protein
MKKLVLIASILLFAVPAMAGRNDTWRVHVNNIYRNGYGYNTVDITVTLAKCSRGVSSLLDFDVCGVTGGGKKICKEYEGGRRMKVGDRARIRVKLGSTEYPIERVYID